MHVSDLQDAFLVCRTIGHAWDDNPHAEVDSDLFKASRGCLALRCTRCFTERFDYLDNQMAVFQRYYRYPQGYEGIKGEERFAPALRAEMFSRSLLIRKARARLKAVS
jgi:hypothetical protein